MDKNMKHHFGPRQKNTWSKKTRYHSHSLIKYKKIAKDSNEILQIQKIKEKSKTMYW